MKILITGSSGWLGRHLMPLLKKQGHNPFGLDPVASEWTDLTISVTERDQIFRLFAAEQFEGVIHAGALHKPDIARYPQQAFIDVNVTGTLNLLEAAIETGVPRFVFTSTTSLMISQGVRDEQGNEAVWMDENFAPIEPRNIYGVTKLAAEALCRQHHVQHGLNTIILRTSRFFPEEDDTLRDLTGPNMKANELLNRRASVGDMARAHIAALEGAERIGFGLYIVSAPTPFVRKDTVALKSDAASVVRQKFPQAEALYRNAGWHLPTSISRVYDGSRMTRDLGFQYETSFETILDALAAGDPMPVDHDPGYASPLLQMKTE